MTAQLIDYVLVQDLLTASKSKHRCVGGLLGSRI